MMANESPNTPVWYTVSARILREGHPEERDLRGVKMQQWERRTEYDVCTAYVRQLWGERFHFEGSEPVENHTLTGWLIEDYKNWRGEWYYDNPKVKLILTVAPQHMEA